MYSQKQPILTFISLTGFYGSLLGFYVQQLFLLLSFYSFSYKFFASKFCLFLSFFKLQFLLTVLQIVKCDMLIRTLTDQVLNFLLLINMNIYKESSGQYIHFMGIFLFLNISWTESILIFREQLFRVTWFLLVSTSLCL